MSVLNSRRILVGEGEGEGVSHPVDRHWRYLITAAVYIYIYLCVLPKHLLTYEKKMILTLRDFVNRNIGIRHARWTDHQRVHRLLHQVQGERQLKPHVYVVVQRSDVKRKDYEWVYGCNIIRVVQQRLRRHTLPLSIFPQ